MARYRPSYKWEVDWSGDDSFSHSRSDITALLLEYRVKWGSNPTLSPDQVLPSTATGYVLTANHTGLLDPDNPAKGVDRDDLLARRRCRLSADNRPIWDGTLLWDRRIESGETNALRWRLDGRYGGCLRNDIELAVDGGTVGTDLVPAITAASGVPVRTTNPGQPIGVINWAGTTMGLLEQLQWFTGSYYIEQHDGSVESIRFAQLPAIPLGAHFDTSFEPLIEMFRRGTRVQHSRSAARIGTTVWDLDVLQRPGETPEPRILTLIQEDLTLESSETIHIPIQAPVNNRWRPNEWTEWRVESNDPRFTGAVVTADDGNQEPGIQNPAQTLIITISTGIWSGGALSARLIGVGKRDVTETLERVITDIEATTDRSQVQPFWLPADFTGVASVVKPWLAALRSPPEHIRTAYRSLQQTSGKAHSVIDHCRPGERNLLSLPTGDNQIEDVHAVVLQAEIRWRLGEDVVHVIDSIATDDIKVPGRFVEARAVDINRLAVEAQEVTLTGATGYLRWRIAGSDDAYNSVTFSVDRETTYITIDNLIPGETYEIDYAVDNTFPAETTASTTGTTRNEIPTTTRISKATLTHTGVETEIMGWDYQRFLAHNTSLRVFGSTGDVTLGIEVQDDQAEWVILPQETLEYDRNNPSLTWLITVTNTFTGQVAEYTLTVNLTITPARNIPTQVSGTQIRGLWSDNTDWAYVYLVMRQGSNVVPQVRRYNVRTGDISPDTDWIIRPNDHAGIDGFQYWGLVSDGTYIWIVRRIINAGAGNGITFTAFNLSSGARASSQDKHATVNATNIAQAVAVTQTFTDEFHIWFRAQGRNRLWRWNYDTESLIQSYNLPEEPSGSGGVFGAVYSPVHDAIITLQTQLSAGMRAYQFNPSRSNILRYTEAEFGLNADNTLAQGAAIWTAGTDGVILVGDWNDEQLYAYRESSGAYIGG